MGARAEGERGARALGARVAEEAHVERRQHPRRAQADEQRQTGPTAAERTQRGDLDHDDGDGREHAHRPDTAVLHDLERALAGRAAEEAVGGVHESVECSARVASSSATTTSAAATSGVTA